MTPKEAWESFCKAVGTAETAKLVELFLDGETPAQVAAFLRKNNPRLAMSPFWPTLLMGFEYAKAQLDGTVN